MLRVRLRTSSRRNISMHPGAYCTHTRTVLSMYVSSSAHSTHDRYAINFLVQYGIREHWRGAGAARARRTDSARATGTAHKRRERRARVRVRVPVVAHICSHIFSTRLLDLDSDSSSQLLALPRLRLDSTRLNSFHFDSSLLLRSASASSLGIGFALAEFPLHCESYSAPPLLSSAAPQSAPCCAPQCIPLEYTCTTLHYTTLHYTTLHSGVCSGASPAATGQCTLRRVASRAVIGVPSIGA